MQGRVTGNGDSATQKLPDNQQRSLAEAVKLMRPGIHAASRIRWKIKQGHFHEADQRMLFVMPGGQK